MNKRNQYDTDELESDFSFAGPANPTRQRQKSPASNKPGRNASRKKGISHRKGNTKGGIHQRGNKRMSW